MTNRFCDELGRRDYVTDKFLSIHPNYAASKEWNASYLPIPIAHLVLSVEAAASISKHIEFYAWKGFLEKVQGCNGVAQAVGCSADIVKTTLKEYQEASQTGVDEFGKTRFVGVPKLFNDDDDTEEFYVGTVTPVLHYCMGGLAIDAQGHVLGKETNVPIPGLYACGEAAGGVHGDNRLAGNSLLECVVYGRLLSETISESVAIPQ